MILEHDEVVKIISDTLSVPEGSVVFKGSPEGLFVEIKTDKFSLCNCSNIVEKVARKERVNLEHSENVHITDRLAKPVKHTMSGLSNNNEQWVECTCCGASNRLGFTEDYPKYCSNCGSRFVYEEQ